ncbi:HlyD family efflux transporter periplasmic adaptor subunit [Chloroflexi bacterium TSY]|nr:HlyD family efflux transporter periplasmic adaptor subunit [Chloroflexi bacterium TSY]
MNKLTYGLAIGAVVLGTAGYFGLNTFAQRRENDLTNAEQMAPIAAITSSDEIIVDAVVVPAREAELSVATGGIVNAVFVEEGDYVQAGQALVQLNDERLQASLAQAEANLSNAQAQLAELLAPPQAAEVAKYESSVTSAQATLQDLLDGASSAEIAAKEADLANAAAELRLAQSDYDEVSWRSDIAMLDEALELEKATNNYNAAKAALDDLLAEADNSDIASANASIVSAQADLDLLLTGNEQEAIDAARATVIANEASVRDAQAALNESTLLAPFSGTVAAVNIEVGEHVSVGVAVIQLADTSEWRIETEDLTELDVVNVARGDAVEISFDALTDVALTGMVKNIKPLGENNQGDITYTVLVELNEQDERLRWNMSAEANITADDVGRAAANQVQEGGQLVTIESRASSQSNGTVLTVADMLADSDTGTVAIETSSWLSATGKVDANGSRLNVRQGPGTSFDVIDSLHDGLSVNVLNRNADGTWIQIERSNGETGWVSADYVTLDNEPDILAVSASASGS